MIESKALANSNELQTYEQNEEVAPVAFHPIDNSNSNDNSSINKLNKLIERRTKKVKVLQEDGDKSHEILAKLLYGDQTHFITELLQNAEDEGAKKVEFKLTKDGLEFSHDAKKLFDFNDIRAISNFNDNEEKKEKPNAIGRFGIGFKSVYSITDKPRIISAEYDITISNYTVPEQNANHTFFNGTRIILPFIEASKERIYELLNKELQNLNLDYLLFLPNISVIKCNDITNERMVEKKDKRFVSLKSGNHEKKYILLEKPVEIDTKILTIKIAFLLNENRKIIECAESKLFVFFPTEIETSLKFLVHAPFHTTPAREYIQQDDYRNQSLIKELGELLAESLSTFKRMKLLNADLLKAMPINKENCSRSSIYNELYNSVKNEISDNTKQLIPNNNGGFSSVNDSMLLGSADLGTILFEKQTKKLFGRSSWVNKGITINNTHELFIYLYAYLNIPEYDLAAVANKIDESFMSEQTDTWLIQFYKVFHKAIALWKKSERSPILRNKPIIRVEKDGKIKQVIPFQYNGDPNVFIPTKEISPYQTVKRNIAKNVEARKFLFDLGLTEPDLFAELNEFVFKRFLSRKLYPDYFEDFKKVVVALQTQDHEKYNRLIQALEGIPFIIGMNYETGEKKLLKFNEVYLPTDILKVYFEGNNEVFFVALEEYKEQQKEKNTRTATPSDYFLIQIQNIQTKEHAIEFYTKNSDKIDDNPIYEPAFHAKKSALSVPNIAELQQLLEKIGVKDYPKRKQIQSVLTWEEKKTLRNGSNQKSENFCKDYELFGLTHFLSQPITLEKSITLWHILIKCMSIGYYDWNRDNFFKGEYGYNFRGPNIKYFDSYFLKQLRSTPWLISEFGELTTASKIFYSNLPDNYKTDKVNSIRLSQIFGFKPDEIKSFEEKNSGYKVIPKDKYEKFEKWELEQSKNTKPQEQNQKNDEKGFEPACKPEAAKLNSREYKADINIRFKNEQGGTISNSGDTKQENDKPEATADKPSQKLLIEIGEWGQSYIARALADEFKDDTSIEIIDLNLPGQTGVGCDFIIKKNGDIVRLVEVKSTIENIGQALSISGTQWEVARTLYKENDGDKYWVYCVFNAGETNGELAEYVIIKNPIKLWKDGELLAHPVNFIVK